ncbi:sensor histidine kinase [Sulfitobacter sp. S0837]|uniref:sensor histidine kinase n=1 Tax=Sulfitobacter maritimus TaxID=2741719 RepID=UPI00158231B7|nr:sensor histidine kinase [Sulfitobacter maritimus]NUH67005.1 sensor histidine kinase [Sulfitobacter maritimus]
MTSGFFSGDLMRGLTIRVLLFLSLALLPIGLIAVVQTRQIADQSRESAELSLIAVTEQASSAERQVIQEAFGAAEALTSIVRLRRDDPQECTDFLREYKQASDIYSLVGFIGLDGRMTCSSTGQEHDFSEVDNFKQLLKNPVRRAMPVMQGEVSKQVVTLINAPVYENRELIGFMSLSIPQDAINAVRENPDKYSNVAMMTVNKMGHILTTENGLETAKQEYPADVALPLLTTKESSVFLSKNAVGTDRAYAIVPIVPETVYALSVWPRDTPFLDTGVSTRLSALLPIVMWVASLIVAFWALNRLAINHIRKLGRQMRRFALNRTLPRGTLGPSVPTELVEMEAAFIGMAESILRDEATLEDSLRQKNILLKEVHHRVKNNLQLISSIMNMQIRQAKSEDARFVLRRLQERILSLATVHKNLYQNDDLVRVDASELLREIVNQSLSIGLPSGGGVQVDQNYETIEIDADDAAPLTLLVSEAVTNALKYVSTVAPGTGFISLKLSYTGPEQAMLEVRNTIGNPEEVQTGTGLGSRLILAFTRQLNGQVEIETRDGVYEMRVNFPVPTDSKMVYDY